MVAADTLRVVLAASARGIYRSIEMREWVDGQWRAFALATNESARYGSVMVDDVGRGRLVMFGGRSSYTASAIAYADTLEWDGAHWLSANPSSRPPARSDHTMIHDRARGEIMLFGGVNAGTRFSDTWVWNGTQWTQRLPATNPPARSGHAMVYDVARDRTLLFGGSTSGASGAPLSDTWEWDGVTWTQRHPTTSPPAMSGHGMTYDAARGRIVLLGGTGGPAPGDTWEWDGQEWNRRQTARSPNRAERLLETCDVTTLAYDSAREKVVLVGGTSLNRPGASSAFTLPSKCV